MRRVAPGLRVTASIHAAERARERVTHLRGEHRDVASAWIETQAGAALVAGRKAVRQPRWCVRDHEEGLRRRGRAPKRGTARFCWDEEETVAFLVRRVNDSRFPSDDLWLVVTTLTPDEEGPS